MGLNDRFLRERDAVAWTFGFEEVNEYQPVGET
jgi:hypothetical protein